MVEPFITTVFYTLFILYGLLRVFESQYSHWGPYLSPFYSPASDPGLDLGRSCALGASTSRFPLLFR